MDTGQNGTIGRIVVGVDGSEGSAVALRWAGRLALAEDAELVVVHVLEPSSYDAGPLGLPRAVLNEADWRETIHDELEETWCAPLHVAGVRHRTRVEEGHAGPGLVAVAAEEHAGLVVMGRRGFPGGVSGFVTHHAPCPVAVVPADPARTPEGGGSRVTPGPGRSTLGRPGRPTRQLHP